MHHHFLSPTCGHEAMKHHHNLSPMCGHIINKLRFTSKFATDLVDLKLLQATVNQNTNVWHAECQRKGMFPVETNTISFNNNNVLTEKMQNVPHCILN